MITLGCAKLDATSRRPYRSLGGSLNAVAGRNSFGVAAEWLARTWQPGLDLVADRILDPTLPPGELARERKYLLDEQQSTGDSATNAAFRLFSEALYQTHPYARDVLGTPAAIAAVERSTLLAFYRERYPVSALTLAIVGDVEIDEVIEHVKARFGGVAKAPRKEPRVAPPKVAAPREMFAYLERAQAHLVIGFPGATVDAADRFAAEVSSRSSGAERSVVRGAAREASARVSRSGTPSRASIPLHRTYLSCAPDKPRPRRRRARRLEPVRRVASRRRAHARSAI